jgi:hypothetical protein
MDTLLPSIIREQIAWNRNIYPLYKDSPVLLNKKSLS